MRIGEKVLSAFSRAPATADYSDAVNQWNLDNALEPLRRAFPGFDTLIQGSRVLDVGCGSGWQVAAMARSGATLAVGIDTNENTLENARRLICEAGIDRAEFYSSLPDSLRGTFDVVVTQNAMEHFGDPEAVLRTMRQAITQAGHVLITFGPPWFAPYGSHMHFFTRVPWVNLLFSERTVMTVRKRFRSDGAARYEEVESGLNRMTVGKFERLIARCGMEPEWTDYHCIKSLNFLGWIPLLRELFINNISCVLHGV